MKYFISYTMRDKEITEYLLDTFSKRLENYGDVFVDLIDNNSIDKQARVIAELDNSDILILIESDSVYKSEWVSLELERASSRQIPIKKISLMDLNNITEIEVCNILEIQMEMS